MPSFPRLLRFLVAAVAVAGCERQTGSDSTAEPATSAGTPTVFAVFAEHEILIDRLEMPVPLAMTAGSDWTMVRSISPEVVSVEGGALVAHRNGRAELRTATDPRPLFVTVRAARSLRIDPDQLAIHPGEIRRVRVLADGEPVPDGAVRWSFSDPDIAVVEGGNIRAGYKLGRARATAAYAGMESSVAIELGQMREPFRVIARNLLLRRGSVEQLLAEVPAGVEVLWSSSDEQVLRPLRGGLFQAHAHGSADACAQVGGQRSCIALSVR